MRGSRKFPPGWRYRKKNGIIGEDDRKYRKKEAKASFFVRKFRGKFAKILACLRKMWYIFIKHRKEENHATCID